MRQTDHLLLNEPCIFPSSLISSWPCFESFARSGEEAKIDLDRLLALQQGSSTSSSSVSVHRPSTDEEVADGCPPSVCEERSLEEVFELWNRGEGHGLYVKDWHLAQQVKAAGGAAFYEDTWAGMTRDDWLNGFYRSQKDEDFRFVVSSLPTLLPVRQLTRTRRLTPVPRDGGNDNASPPGCLLLQLSLLQRIRPGQALESVPTFCRAASPSRSRGPAQRADTGRAGGRRDAISALESSEGTVRRGRSSSGRDDLCALGMVSSVTLSVFLARNED